MSVFLCLHVVLPVISSSALEKTCKKYPTFVSLSCTTFSHPILKSIIVTFNFFSPHLSSLKVIHQILVPHKPSHAIYIKKTFHVVFHFAEERLQQIRCFPDSIKSCALYSHINWLPVTSVLSAYLLNNASSNDDNNSHLFCQRSDVIPSIFYHVRLVQYRDVETILIENWSEFLSFIILVQIT